ncbi:hypothetical protein [Deinococcus hohokamensis]|uniref:Leucine rich repeat variant n=1 Tax=Deinococcus hohokamensis TaxID=309883 RepID=A0ABV9I9V9_9DEIO
MTGPKPASAAWRLAPGLPAAELQALEGHPDDRVQAEVARHANTPAETLGRLGARFPAEVLANPALPLLRLASPSLGRNWPLPTLEALVGQPAAPFWLLRLAAAHPNAALARCVARRERLPPELLCALAQHPLWSVRAHLAARLDLPANLMALLAGDPDYGVRQGVAGQTALPEAVRTQLRRDRAGLVRRTLARSEQAGLALFVAGMGQL